MPVVLYVDRNGFFWPETSANRNPEVTLNFKRCGQQLELVSRAGDASAPVDITRAKRFVMEKKAA